MPAGLKKLRSWKVGTMINNNELAGVGGQMTAALEELIETGGLKPGNLLVIGCSTSVVIGEKMGTAGSLEVAEAILTAVLAICRKYKLQPVIQCCEHLNRALVVERELVDKYFLEEVRVIPMPKAGGSLAAQAMRSFNDPAVVETIQAHAALDIGGTLVGMHLKRVAVPLRLQQQKIGQASVTAGYTRPKLIGGARAVYEWPDKTSQGVKK